MKTTICLRDFNIMCNTVDLLMQGKDLKDHTNSVTIEHEPHAGGYSLFVSINTSIKGVSGTFRTEIIGDTE